MQKLELNTIKELLSITALKKLNELVGSNPRAVEKWVRALTFSPIIAYVSDQNGKLIAFGRIDKYDWALSVDKQGS